MKWPFLLLACLPLGIHAQWERLNTDRPDQTEATTTVPMGSLQLEMGAVIFPHSGGRSDLSLPQILFRFGLGERVEFRVEGERTVTGLVEGGQQAAWAPPLLGAKIAMGEGGNTGIRTAVLVNVGIPRWSDEQDGDPYAGLRLAADRDFGEHFGLGANLAVEWDGQDTAPTPLYTLSGGLELSRRFAAFAEVYGALPQHGAGEHRWDCGGTWAIGQEILADASFGNSFNSEGWFFGAGFSFRVHCCRKKTTLN